MLKYFYDCCPAVLPQGFETRSPVRETTPPGNTYKNLFDSFAIRGAGQKYIDKMGQFPVIFLSFKNIKEQDWETTYRKIKKLVRKEYLKHDYLLNSPKLKSPDKDDFKKIIQLKGEREDYENSLENLLIFLYQHYGKRAVILIDEYDAPVHEGCDHDFYDDIIHFMRNFLGGFS
jgi:hypothetical protein